MAEKMLVDASVHIAGVTPAEMERFKLERNAELEFLSKLSILVRELDTKVSPRNGVRASMARFLKARV